MTTFIEVQGERVPAMGVGTWQLSGDEAREEHPLHEKPQDAPRAVHTSRLSASRARSVMKR